VPPVGGVWADASEAMKPDSEQSAQDATLAKSRRESMVTSLIV
jgi:hypothetical protein